MWFADVFDSAFQVGMVVGSGLSGFAIATWIVVHFIGCYCYFGIPSACYSWGFYGSVVDHAKRPIFAFYCIVI